MGLTKYKDIWQALKGQVVRREALGRAYHSLYTAGYLYPILRGIYYVMGEEEKALGKPAPSPYQLLAKALTLLLGKEWHFTGSTALFLLGLRNQPPSFIEVANTRYSGERERPFPIRFYRLRSLAPYCAVEEVDGMRIATKERVNADFLYLYMRGKVPLEAVPSFSLPPCSAAIHPLLERLASILNPAPLPFREIWGQALYVDALLSLTVPYVEEAVGPFLPISPLVLKGGTALVKAYLGHYRFSYDMDFSFRAVRPNYRKCRRLWKAEVMQVVKALGFSIAGEAHTASGRITTLSLSAPFVERPIKLTVSCLDGPLCRRAKRRPLKALLRDYTRHGWVMDVAELMAEKLRALATRASLKEGTILYRDLVDLYYLKKAGVPLDRPCLKQKLEKAERVKTYREALERFLRAPPSTLYRKDPALLSSPPPDEELLSLLSWAQQEVGRALEA